MVPPSCTSRHRAPQSVNPRDREPDSTHHFSCHLQPSPIASGLELMILSHGNKQGCRLGPASTQPYLECGHLLTAWVATPEGRRQGGSQAGTPLPQNHLCSHLRAPKPTLLVWHPRTSRPTWSVSNSNSESDAEHDMPEQSVFRCTLCSRVGLSVYFGGGERREVARSSGQKETGISSTEDSAEWHFLSNQTIPLNADPRTF